MRNKREQMEKIEEGPEKRDDEAGDHHEEEPMIVTDPKGIF